MKQSPAQTFVVELESHAEQGRIGLIEQAIREAGGEVLRSSSLTNRIWYVAETSLQEKLRKALDR